MRDLIGTASFAAAILTVPVAWGQGVEPVAPPPSAAPLPETGMAPVGTQPQGATLFPPPAPWMSPVQPPPPSFSTTPPPAAPPGPPPLQVAGRLGLGLGVWGAPVLLAGSADAAGKSSLLGAAYGSALGARWWTSERVVVIPSLRLSVDHRDFPAIEENGQYAATPATSQTSAAFAPSVSFGYAVHRGKMTRFLLSAGIGASYAVVPTLSARFRSEDGRLYSQYLKTKTWSISVPAGFSLEQFFTPKISVVLGAEAPLFYYDRSTLAEDEPTDAFGTTLDTTRASASVFFYLD